MEQKRLTCGVCGREFTPFASSRYTVKSKTHTLLNAEVTYYDAFDCPRCGCQVIAQERIVDENDILEKTEKEIEGETNSKDVYPELLDIIFDDRADVEALKGWIEDIFNAYGCVTVADYSDLAEFPNKTRYTAYKYGWEDLSEMRILHRKDGGYILHMPPAKRLDVKENSK